MGRTLVGAALLSGALLGTTLWRLFTPAPAVRTLPALELTALDGRFEPLERTGAVPEGAPTVVHLWTTDCVACQEEFELLARASRSARYGGFRYLFVNQGNDAAVVRRYLELSSLPEGVAEDILLDPDSSAYDAFGASSLPASYFFWEDGTLHEAHGVIQGAGQLENILEPLLGEP